ncbi:hypothetical protein CFC21_029841 [Triticum aestivum]|uniref:SANTA domain-containing protein n=3 Tax=Triticinae TaxID=1648030 RepID=A0A9R1JG02_WHEAT|nr:uncharacterized protein LOC109745658 isoform X1 [Aegilops tauschii subsp. strangulata]XP_044332388.1 uncharacterized protein LOC123053070 isoform X1 [Triticum aestivum]KAF7016165.1 hypothetical protein CFC21_029841 [Triticum aestivum]
MAKKTPSPPPRARSRRGAAPTSPTPAAALSPPFSPAPLRTRLGAAAVAAAAAAAAAASSSPVEHPCVTLCEWWPVRVEGEERKLAVSGFTERNDAFTSAPIAHRYEPLTLQDEGGVVVLLHGSINLLRMRENGFSVQICEQFMIGFPFWWETWDSHMESYPNCFIDPREGSAQFYLEKFQLGNFIQKFGPSFIEDLLNNAKNFPIDHLDAFTESSRFQEYICGNDASTKENSAASDDARPATVANVEIGLTASSISQERDHVDIECNVSLAPAETYTGDETCKEAGNQNDTMHPDAREEDAGSHLFNSDWTCTMCPDHMPNDSEGGNATSAENATMSPDNMPNDSEGGNVTSAKNATMSPDHMSPDNMPNDSEGGNATGAENSVELLAKYPLAIVPPENANCCSEIPGASQSVEPSSYQSTPVASLKNQHCLETTEHITLTQKAVSNEDTPSSIHSDVQSQEKQTVGSAEKRRSAKQVLERPTRSPMTRTSAPYGHKSRLTRSRAQSLSISTPECLKMRRTKSGRVVVPQLDPGSSRIVYDNNGLISGVAPVTGLLRSSPAKFACHIPI